MEIASAVFVSLALGFGVLFLHPHTWLGNDWRYFTMLSLFVRSSVLHYHEAPIFNPWLCGGLDTLTNPQSRVFSPSLILDLALNPFWANAATLLITAGLGTWGMAVLLARLGVSRATSLAGAVLFVNSSWFTLHYAEGHIAFGWMQLFPWVAVFTLGLPAPRSFLALGLLLTLMIVDGGIYSFIFSLYLIATILVMKWNGQSIQSALRPLFSKKSLPLTLLITATCACLAASKLLPVLLNAGNIPQLREHYEMPAWLVARALFWPFQFLDTKNLFGRYEFHEYGCYIGVTAALLVAGASALSQPFRRANRSTLIAAAFWFWVAIGTFWQINPWRIHGILPLMNNAHLQSRLFILFWFFFIVLLARALDLLNQRHLRVGALLTILMLGEFFFVRSYTWERAYEDYPVLPVPGLIANQGFLRTSATRAENPHFYFDEPESGSADCYEPSFLHHLVVPTGTRGDVRYLDPPSGMATLDTVIPNQISLHYEAERPGIFQLNLNHQQGWRVAEGEADILSHPRMRLLVKARQSSGSLLLRYFPGYLPLQLILYGLGWLGFIAAWLQIKTNRKYPQAR